ncbi:hypothetical protein BB560_003793 [Smittium megazygosporum]|uniref:Rap-GAP domain-containing protein n=1 Tax=Smittium megazygosporum TaxID=133381 RepID=A0A2T9ZB61_9FUNG|nr:hypothetical protein BB560_003793 [Smittium megazygosporum]
MELPPENGKNSPSPPSPPFKKDSTASGIGSVIDRPYTSPNSSSAPAASLFDARKIVVRDGDLTLEKIPLDRRLAAIDRTTACLKQKKSFINLPSLWDAVRDLVPQASNNPQISNALFELIIPLLLCSTQDSQLNQDNILSDHANAFSPQDYIEMTNIIILSKSCSQISRSAQILSTATKDFTVIYPISLNLFSFLSKSIQVALENSCFRSKTTCKAPSDPSIDPTTVLLTYLDAMILHIQNNYPLLDDSHVSFTVVNICYQAIHMLVDWNHSFYSEIYPPFLEGVFRLILSLASYGFIPQSLNECITSLICLSTSFKKHIRIASNLAKQIFLSSYIRDIAQSMMRIVVSHTESFSLFDPQCFSKLNTKRPNEGIICCSPDVFHDSKPTLTHLLVIQGIIHSITQLLYPDFYSLLDYNVVADLFLPIILASLEIYKVQHRKIPELLSPPNPNIRFDIHQTKLQILVFLSNFIEENSSDSLVPYHWGMIIDIISYIRDDISDYSEYESNLLFCGNIINFMAPLMSSNSFPDDLAIDLMDLSSRSQETNFENNAWYIHNEIQTFFFDTNKSLEVRRKLCEIVEKRILYSQSESYFLNYKQLVLKMVDHISNETDPLIINSLINISRQILKYGLPEEFQTILNGLCFVVSSAESSLILNRNTLNDPIHSITENFSNLMTPSLGRSQDTLSSSFSSETFRSNLDLSLKSPPFQDLPDQENSYNDIYSIVKQERGKILSIGGSTSYADAIAQHTQDPTTYKAALVSKLFADLLWHLLSGERISPGYKSTPPSRISNSKFLFDPSLTTLLLDSVLDLATDFNISPIIRLILVKPLLLLRADFYNRIYIISSTEQDKYSSWRPIVRNPVFTETVGSFDDRKSETPSQYSDVLLLYDKWNTFSTKKYLSKMTMILFNDTLYEIIETVASGLEIQLSNTYFFIPCSEQIQSLLQNLTNDLDGGRYANQVGGHIKLKQVGRIPLIILGYRILTRLISYKNIINHSGKSRLVQTFQNGLTKGSHLMARPCIHALNICMLELPDIFKNMLPPILNRVLVTHSASSMGPHIVEFLSALARQPELFVNLVVPEYKIIIEIAMNFIKSHSASFSRLANQKSAGHKDLDKSGKGLEIDGSSAADVRISGLERASSENKYMPVYMVVMAYQAIDAIYLCLRPEHKLQLVDLLLQGLLSSNIDKNDITELNEVCIDMIFRFMFMDSEQVLKSEEIIVEADLGEVEEFSWIQGRGVITIRAQKNGKLAQISVQRPSNMYSKVVDLSAMAIDILKNANKNYANKPFIDATSLADSDILLPSANNLTSLEESTINKILNGKNVPIASKNKYIHFPIIISTRKSFVEQITTVYPQYVGMDRPIQIPPNNTRALRTINLMRLSPTIDTHKIGVIYVGPKQKTELEILSNTHGSAAYWAFLRGLGNIVRLSSVQGYNGGLDTTGLDTDGRFGIQWNDSISHIVFHVATLLPNQDLNDGQLSTQLRKKAHIGNDFVHIIFNESGTDYDFNTLMSQFNYVQIIVTPADFSIETLSSGSLESYDSYGSSNSFDTQSVISDERLYWVQTKYSPKIPPIGPAIHPKLVTLKALPGLVRISAIHANTFLMIYSSFVVHQPGEYVSNWRHRLRSFKRLKDTVTLSESLSMTGSLNQGSQSAQSKKNSTTADNKKYSSPASQSGIGPHSKSSISRETRSNTDSTANTSKSSIKNIIPEKGFFSPFFSSLQNSPAASTQDTPNITENASQVFSSLGNSPLGLMDSKGGDSLSSLKKDEYELSKEDNEKLKFPEINNSSSEKHKLDILGITPHGLSSSASFSNQFEGSDHLHFDGPASIPNPETLSDQNQISLILRNYSIKRSAHNEMVSPISSKSTRVIENKNKSDSDQHNEQDDLDEQSEPSIENLFYNYDLNKIETYRHNVEMSSLLENPSVAPIDKFCLSGLDLSCSDLTAAEIAQNVASKLGDYFNCLDTHL